VDNERQHLPDAVQPEVFLHLTESLAQTVTRIRVRATSARISRCC
jgi:Fe-S cluster assembly protein SufD